MNMRYDKKEKGIGLQAKSKSMAKKKMNRKSFGNSNNFQKGKVAANSVESKKKSKDIQYRECEGFAISNSNVQISLRKRVNLLTLHGVMKNLKAARRMTKIK